MCTTVGISEWKQINHHCENKRKELQVIFFRGINSVPASSWISDFLLKKCSSEVNCLLQILWNHRRMSSSHWKWNQKNFYFQLIHVVYVIGTTNDTCLHKIICLNLKILYVYFCTKINESNNRRRGKIQGWSRVYWKNNNKTLYFKKIESAKKIFLNTITKKRIQLRKIIIIMDCKISHMYLHSVVMTYFKNSIQFNWNCFFRLCENVGKWFLFYFIIINISSRL